PLSPGPTFFSSLSGLWHTAHCSNTALPLAASPLPADSITLEPAAKPTHNVRTRNRCIVRRFSRGRSKYLTPPIGIWAPPKSGVPPGHPDFALISLQERAGVSGQQLLRLRSIGDGNYALIEDGHVLQHKALALLRQHAVFTRVMALLHAQFAHEILQCLALGHRLRGAQCGIERCPESRFLRIQRPPRLRQAFAL